MIDYLVCSVFFLCLTILLYMLGRAVEKEDNISENLICGYVLYSFGVAVGGIILQLLNAPWILFEIYIGIIWLSIIFYIIYNRKKVKYFDIDFKKYISENWVIYGVCIILVFMMCFYYAGFLLGNHQDDGYYITKVATLPYSQIGGNYNYTVGINGKGFNAYIVNTWELEASVYVKILGVVPTLFLRWFQSIFYYFLYLNLIKLLAEKITQKLHWKVNVKYLQYPTIITVLISAYYIALSDYKILNLRDMFQLNTGMFLGATMVKLFGVAGFVILYLKFQEEKDYLRLFGSWIVYSVVLMSKSTIALPIILIVMMACTILYFWDKWENRGRRLCYCLLIIYIAIGILLPNKSGIATATQGEFLRTADSIVIWPCIVIFICSFLLKEKIIYKINTQIFLMTMLVLIPQVNDWFENFSVYEFVAGRAWTAVAYYFLILNMIYLFVLLDRIKIKKTIVYEMGILIGIACFMISTVGFKLCGGEILPQNEHREAGVRKCLSVMRHNIYFVPDSTINLGSKLEELARKEDKKMYVIMPKAIYDNDALHFPAVTIRTFAPDIVSLSALERFGSSDNEKFSTYTQQKYDGFVSAPGKETYNDFKEEIKDLPVNCIVVRNYACKDILEEDGYIYYTSINDYHIWYKNK